jgi:hypothetical protein
MQIILEKCHEKHNFTINYEWIDIYNILNNNNNKKLILINYLNYKLKPILNNMSIIDFLKNFLNL